MTQTISKHIGEGFGKGELYAALAYDTSDSFGGMRIKSIYIADGKIEIGYSGWTGLYLHTTTDSDGKYGLYSLTTATHATGTVWGLYGDVSWTGSGYVGLTGVQGRVTVGGDFNSGTNYVYGTTGQLAFANATVINSGPSIFAAVNAVITGDTGGTFTTGKICGLFIQNLFDKDISSKSDVWALLYMANNVNSHGPTDAIHLYGPYVDNFVNFAGCTNGGMVSNAAASAVHGTLSKKIRIIIDSVDYYLLASTTPAG